MVLAFDAGEPSQPEAQVYTERRQHVDNSRYMILEPDVFFCSEFQPKVVGSDFCEPQSVERSSCYV